MMMIGHAFAQTCQQPTLITQPVSLAPIDTCALGYSPQSLCTFLSPAGPAIAFEVILAYPQPGYTFYVQPTSPSEFDPIIVVQSQQCGESGKCPFTVDGSGAGQEETFNLGQLDSGRYYLIVTSINPGAGCGEANFGVTGVFYDDNGIFRSGMDY